MPKTKQIGYYSDAPGSQQYPAMLEAVYPTTGNFVAFASGATNLAGGDTNGYQDVFVRDLGSHTTKRVSLSSTGAQGDGHSFDPAISADGQLVAFASLATNLVGADTNGDRDIFVRNLRTHRTRRVSVSSAGAQGDGDSFEPTISANGRFVAFASDATNLVGGDTNAHTDVFVRNLRTRRTQRVSLSSARAQGDSGSFLVADPSSISADGRFVSFISAATNLVAGDTNAKDDVFLRDRKSRKTRLLSRSLGGGFGNGTSINPAISADGRFVAFASDATNLIGHDTNGLIDVFVRGPLR